MTADELSWRLLRAEDGNTVERPDAVGQRVLATGYGYGDMPAYLCGWTGTVTEILRVNVRVRLDNGRTVTSRPECFGRIVEA